MRPSARDDAGFCNRQGFDGDRVVNWRWLLFDYADPTLPLSFAQRMRVATRMISVWKMPAKMRMGRYLFGAGFLPICFGPQFVLLFAQPGWTTPLAAALL